MGLKSYFLLINATPWTITRVSEKPHQYQMIGWGDWPKSFAPGASTPRFQMEGKNSLVYGQDDGGEVTYRLGSGPGNEFEILYHGRKNADPTVKVDLLSLKTVNNPAQSVINLQYTKNNNVPLILAARKGSKDPKSSLVVSNNPPTSWMQSIYSQISCLELREVVMPGSHDAGMSEFNQGSGLASAINTVTQKLSIAKQLDNGARWFDIRPVISGGHVKTGHYGYSAGMWRGGNGQDLSEVIQQVNDFTAKNKELVILDLTHGLNTDKWDGEHSSMMTQAQWDQTLNQLMGLKNLFILPAGVKDVTSLKISQIINNRAAVVVVVRDIIKDNNKKSVDISKFTSRGIMNGDNFGLFNEYSNTNDQKKMVDDQLRKLAKNRTKTKDPMFLLSWTLTQNSALEPIVENGQQANHALPELLWPRLSANSYPNILMIDAYPSNRDVAALAMAINLYHTRTC